MGWITNSKSLTHDPKDSSSLSSDKISTLFLDLEDNIWIGTAHGLNKYDWLEEKFISPHYQ